MIRAGDTVTIRPEYRGEGEGLNNSKRGNEMTTKLAHRVNGKLYVALDIPEHRTLDSYKACVRRAYGSLRGVTFETVERPA